MGSEEVRIGVIGRPHGIKGDVFVQLRTDSPEIRFAAGAEVLLGSTHDEVVRASRRGNSMIVKFAGIPDRTRAEQLQGMDVLTRVDTDEQAGPDEVYDRRLRGLAVLVAGESVGEVVDVMHLPGQDILQIRVGKEIRSVPFVTQLVPEVDLADGTLSVANIPGLLWEHEDAD